MFDERCHKIADRIVSVSQPHVRPIVRGKAGREVEFGAKISASVVDGYAFLDRLSWDAYHEAADIPNQVEKYKERFGFYPEVVLAMVFTGHAAIAFGLRKKIFVFPASLSDGRRK